MDPRGVIPYVELDVDGDKTFVPQQAVTAAGGSITPTTAPANISLSYALDQDSGSWFPVFTATAAQSALTSGNGSTYTIPPGHWSVRNAPASDAQASASKAAGGAGFRHVLCGFTVNLLASIATAGTTGLWVIRDGATGAGTILLSGRLTLLAETTPVYRAIDRDSLSGLNIPGSDNTAMTIEFTGGLADTVQQVMMWGYTLGALGS